MHKILIYLLPIILASSACATGSHQRNHADPKAPPLLSINDFVYKGAFIMDKKATYGDSDNKYASAVFELSADKSSFYFGGRKVNTAIGEFGLPKLVVSDNIADLNVAKVKQNYSSIIGTKKNRFDSKRIPTGNPQKIDRITGLILHNGMLVANVSRYYDGKAHNTHTTMLISDPADLANSAISGFYSLEGAAHASGWISEISPEWQDALGGNFITGWASSFPIAGRNSIGPSAFVVNLNDINPSANPDTLIPTTALMDFSLANPIHPDKANETGENNLWTVISWAVYGFIIPNTRTYAVFGSSGGHDAAGTVYKLDNDIGYHCPGPCAYKHDDYYNYYWFFNVDDLVAVKNGKKLAHEVRPYDYGVFPAPFQSESDITSKKLIPIRPIRGGSYDQKTNTLYLVLGGSLQKKQIVIAYNLMR